jgi:NAD(P) transhydrogenase subunit alpha
MNPAVLIASVYVFALAAFLGYQVISRVPPLLHTPLMSATNAISGISLIGSLVLAGAGTTRCARTFWALSPSPRPPSTWSADSASPTAC